MASSNSTPSTDALPLDPDVEVSTGRAGAPRPVHLRPALIGLVGLGGITGTAVREAVSLLVPNIDALPLAILLINLVGAFALGVLLESLTRRGADEGRRRTARLLLGTGFLGGFTTYSALASDSALLLSQGGPDALLGGAYALGSALGGIATAASGIALASRLHAHGTAVTRA